MSEPELGPGLTEWIVLLGNAGLQISLQGSLPLLSLGKLTPLFSSLPSQPRSPTRKALASSASCQPSDGCLGEHRALGKELGAYGFGRYRGELESVCCSALLIFLQGLPYLLSHSPSPALGPTPRRQAASPANPHPPSSLTGSWTWKSP